MESPEFQKQHNNLPLAQSHSDFPAFPLHQKGHLTQVTMVQNACALLPRHTLNTLAK